MSVATVWCVALLLGGAACWQARLPLQYSLYPQDSLHVRELQESLDWSAEGDAGGSGEAEGWRGGVRVGPYMIQDLPTLQWLEELVTRRLMPETKAEFAERIRKELERRRLEEQKAGQREKNRFTLKNRESRRPWLSFSNPADVLRERLIQQLERKRQEERIARLAKENDIFLKKVGK